MTVLARQLPSPRSRAGPRTMSEAVHRGLPRPSRAERTTTSCGECRRRKQKCNQGQPCGNCQRRFPQPLCEYKSHANRRSSAIAPSIQQQPPFAVALLPPSPRGDGSFGMEGPRQPLLPLRPTSPGSSAWGRRPGDEIPSRWSPVEPSSQSPRPTSPIPYYWSTARTNFSSYVLSCEEGCTSHSQDVHDAIRMLRAYPSTASRIDLAGWGPAPLGPWQGQFGAPGAMGGQWGSPGTSPELMSIPAAQTMQHSELLAIYIKLVSPFKASIDGNPDPSNPYLKYHVPYTVQSPLLVHVAIYTAACFLSETGHVDTTTAMDHKGFAIKLLKEHIRSTAMPTDEGITGVVQLIIDEWLWGDTNDLRAHLSGLREMIKLRGGFRTLGLHGLISKLAITSDVAVALSFETPPFLQGPGTDFDFSEGGASPPLRLPLNTPFLSSLPRFANCDDALHIHPAVASLLDDMRFLLAAVHALPARASPKELQKVRTTAAWIHDRILSLPADAPTPRRSPEPRPSPPPKPARPDPADYIYQAVRLTALLYAQAIQLRRPFSAVVTPEAYMRLWTTAWRVPLATWRSLLGVFAWMLVPLVPAGRGSEQHDRFVKALFGVALLQVGMDNWEVCAGMMERVGGLVRWLGEGERSSGAEREGDGESGRRGSGGDVERGGGETSPGGEWASKGRGKGKERET